MSLITTLRAPGTGRRQADPIARLAAENQRLQEQVDQARAELRHTASVLGEFVVLLGEEQAAHWQTREERDQAVRANRSNSEAETLQTDVTALRAAIADQYVEEPGPGPQYRPYPRFPTNRIRVVPLWLAPFATTDPGHVRLGGAA
ncbi:MAG: hypothetical protein HOW97_02450 [Catenulispora sp.]|nr:hypothetical protein [Catenulispora sp.]